MQQSKISTLLTKGVRALTLDSLVGEPVIITTRYGNTHKTTIRKTILDRELDFHLVEFVTDTDYLVIIEKNGVVALLYGNAILAGVSTEQQESVGNRIHSITLAGLTILNDGVEALIREDKIAS